MRSPPSRLLSLLRHRRLAPFVALLSIQGAGCEPADEAGSPTEQGADPLAHTQSLRDFNRDGLPDLLWHHPSSGTLSAWLTDGNVRVIGIANGNRLVPLRTGPVGFADTSADLQQDLVMHDPELGTVTNWFANGMNLSPQAPLAWKVKASDGWRPVSGGDVNGDAVPDFVWFHPGEGKLSYWYDMASPRAHHFPAARAGSGWTPIGMGDFNKDALHTDVLWFHAQSRQLVVWIMNQSGELVRGEAIAMQPDPGWVPLALQHVDTAISQDILWQNTTTRVVSAWLMNGTTVTGIKNFSMVPDPGWNLVP